MTGCFKRAYFHVVLGFFLLVVGCDSAEAEPRLEGEAPASATPPEPNPSEPAPSVADEPAPPLSPPADTPSPNEVTIMGTGDILIHQRVIAAAERDPNGYRGLFRGLAPHLQDDVISFANLESPLVRDVRSLDSTTPPVLGGDPEAAQAFREIGLDVVGLGNNHAYDQASSGLRRTLEAVRAAGLVAVGAHEDPEGARRHVVMTHTSGKRVAFLSYGRHVNLGPGRTREAFIALFGNEVQMMAAVRAARADADLVVMAAHWGADFIDEPRPWQRALARRLVEQGVDLILGTGPHILHEVEELPSPRGRAIVAYSLGNFISNQGLRYALGNPNRRMFVRATQDGLSRDAALLFVSFSFGPAGEIQPARVEALPLWVENNFLEVLENPELSHAIYVHPLSEASSLAREERLPLIRRQLGPRVTLRPFSPAVSGN